VKQVAILQMGEIVAKIFVGHDAFFTNPLLRSRPEPGVPSSTGTLLDMDPRDKPGGITFFPLRDPN